MKRYFFVIFLIVLFSFDSCNDDDDDHIYGDPNIKFTERFDMTLWQRKFTHVEYSYLRLEKNNPYYQNRWRPIDGDSCYLNSEWNPVPPPHPIITIFKNTENYLKYDIELYPRRTMHYELTYKNGTIEVKKIDGDLNLGKQSWEKAEIDLNTLKMCDY